MQASDFLAILDQCPSADKWRSYVLDEFWDEHDLAKELNDFGCVITREEQYGGEGMGDDWWVIFSVLKDGEKSCFRIDGWYTSYEGVDFSDSRNLIPVTKKQVLVDRWVENE